MTCSAGKCSLSCAAPYQDCNGDIGDGCEIPVGVANTCDVAGLNSGQGCGTAYCGAFSGGNNKTFGSWTCVFCSHCHKWSDGYSWCLGTSTGKFSSDRCETCCNDGMADKVCTK
jgi:hypothetical protein